MTWATDAGLDRTPYAAPASGIGAGGIGASRRITGIEASGHRGIDHGHRGIGASTMDIEPSGIRACIEASEHRGVAGHELRDREEVMTWHRRRGLDRTRAPRRHRASRQAVSGHRRITGHRGIQFTSRSIPAFVGHRREGGGNPDPGGEEPGDTGDHRGFVVEIERDAVGDDVPSEIDIGRQYACKWPCSSSPQPGLPFALLGFAIVFALRRRR